MGTVREQRRIKQSLVRIHILIGSHSPTLNKLGRDSNVILKEIDERLLCYILQIVHPAGLVAVEAVVVERDIEFQMIVAHPRRHGVTGKGLSRCNRIANANNRLQNAVLIQEMAALALTVPTIDERNCNLAEPDIYGGFRPDYRAIGLRINRGPRSGEGRANVLRQ